MKTFFCGPLKTFYVGPGCCAFTQTELLWPGWSRVSAADWRQRWEKNLGWGALQRPACSKAKGLGWQMPPVSWSLLSICISAFRGYSSFCRKDTDSFLLNHVAPGTGWRKPTWYCFLKYGLSNLFAGEQQDDLFPPPWPNPTLSFLT